MSAQPEPRTPAEQHWLWRAIKANEKVNAVRDLHRPEMDSGGLPTGRCRECGKPWRCPTALAVARRPDGPCDCGPDCPVNAQARVSAANTHPESSEETSE